MTFIPYLGACVNPAIAMMFCLTGKLSWKRYPLYVVCEFLGAFIAAAVTYGSYNGESESFLNTNPHWLTQLPLHIISLLQIVRLKCVLAFSSSPRSETKCWPVWTVSPARLVNFLLHLIWSPLLYYAKQY